MVSRGASPRDVGSSPTMHPLHFLDKFIEQVVEYLNEKKYTKIGKSALRTWQRRSRIAMWVSVASLMYHNYNSRNYIAIRPISMLQFYELDTIINFSIIIASTLFALLACFFTGNKTMLEWSLILFLACVPAEMITFPLDVNKLLLWNFCALYNMFVVTAIFSTERGHGIARDVVNFFSLSFLIILLVFICKSPIFHVFLILITCFLVY